MNRLRAASARSNITIYEDEPKEGDHDFSENLEPNDENQVVLDKLEELEDLSQSLREISRAYSHSVSLESSMQLQDDFEGSDHHSPEHDELDVDLAPENMRHTSETFSVLSSDNDILGIRHSPPVQREYLSPLPRRKIKHNHLRSGQFQIAAGCREPLSSSPRDQSPSISISQRLMSSPRSPVVEHQRSSAFRHPSSVRAMQMSSPSPPPFANSPRSARHRASNNSRNSTPVRHLQSGSVRCTTPTPSPLSRHPNPNKEYPLVLLHCTIAQLHLPYSQKTLQTVLPGWVIEDLAILREKLGATVLERGILISHPGEDYELLEERVLESLELKRPRVAKCGHFLGDNEGPVSHEETHDLNHTCMSTDPSTTTKPACMTCANPIAINLSILHPASPWTLKVYAANGLLRSGSWGAAWREMERVDVEVGVFIPDDVRRTLEREEDAELERGRLKAATAYNGARPTSAIPEDLHADVNIPAEIRRSFSGNNAGYRNTPAASRRTSGTTAASTAACTREITTSNRNNTSIIDETTRSNSKKPSVRQQTPLVTLLIRYFTRQAEKFAPRVLLAFSVALLGVLYLLFFKNSKPLVTLRSHSSTTPIPSIPKSALEAVGLSTTKNEGPDAGRYGDAHDLFKRACTFPSDRAGEAGMTALPFDIARSVLGVLGVSATTSTSSSVTTSSSVSISTSTSTSLSFYTSISTTTTETMPVESTDGASVDSGVTNVLKNIANIVLDDNGGIVE